MMKNFLAFSLLNFVFVYSANASNITVFNDEFAVVSIDIILPDDITRVDVLSIEFVDGNDVSSTYKISTCDGETIFQTVSMALLSYLPNAMQYACLATIKNPTVCTSVYYAGQAIIAIFADNIKETIDSWGKAKVTDNEGIAYVTSRTKEEAEETRLAFKHSHENTNFPWQKIVIRGFSNHSSRNLGY